VYSYSLQTSLTPSPKIAVLEQEIFNAPNHACQGIKVTKRVTPFTHRFPGGQVHWPRHLHEAQLFFDGPQRHASPRFAHPLAVLAEQAPGPRTGDGLVAPPQPQHLPLYSMSTYLAIKITKGTMEEEEKSETSSSNSLSPWMTTSSQEGYIFSYCSIVYAP